MNRFAKTATGPFMMRNFDVQHEMPFLRLLAKENVLPLMHDLGMTEHKDEIMNLFDEQVVATFAAVLAQL